MNNGNGDVPAGDDYPRCNAKKKDGTRCRAWAGMGTSHKGYHTCKFHGGSTRSSTMRAELIRAQGEMPFMGDDIVTSPVEGLTTAIAKTAGQLAYASQRVRALDPLSEEAERSAWLRIQQDLIDRLARYSKMGLEMRVEERAMNLTEMYADALANALINIMDDLGIDDCQDVEIQEIVRRRLMEQEQGSLPDHSRHGIIIEPVSQDSKRTAAFVEKQERRING